VSTEQEIIGLIPAAGKGSRLGLPYPKELFPTIRGNRYKPVSQFVVRNLVEADVKHIVFVINETKHQLIGFFGSGSRFNCRISYVVQESHGDELKSSSPGLSHALDSAFHLVRNKTVYFGMADTIIEPREIFSQARKAADGKNDYDVILILFSTNRPEKFGMVAIDNDMNVLEIIDKPQQTNLTMMWGCIIWRPSFTEHLHECVNRLNISDFADIMNRGIKSGLRFRGVCIPDSNYIDIGTCDEIKEIENLFK
jgi:glucose-1-phosphate thymidylyltransferase